MKKAAKILYFEDKPIFGLDIGHGSLRVMQIDTRRSKPKLVGYGTASFDPTAIKDGAIDKPEIIAKAAQELFRKNLVGDITTNRVALSLPVAHAFTRSMYIPNLSEKETAEAVRTEAEQYIPAAIDDLYLDYSRAKASGDTNELFLVAMPKRIVDSHLLLTRMLGLEAVLFETSIGAGAQLFARDKQSDVASVLVDFGTESADITVYNGGLVVSGTVACGGDKITQLISETLGVTMHEANIVKAKYGLGYSKKQKQVEAGLEPLLNLLIKEIRRTIRYYEERSGSKQPISQVIIIGGGANMPGLADYLTNSLRVAVRGFDPTPHMDFGRLQPFSPTERMSYVTVAGLALTNPAEVFA
jgi:type IV pilus assembly protein PilM